jgi:hypothetical protein
MPVVLDKVDIGPWLNGEAGTELLTPAAEFLVGRPLLSLRSEGTTSRRVMS